MSSFVWLTATAHSAFFEGVEPFCGGFLCHIDIVVLIILLVHTYHTLLVLPPKHTPKGEPKNRFE